MGKVTNAIDRVVDAAGRYWAIPSAAFGVIGALGMPHVPDEAVPWAALAGGFIVYAAGFSIGRKVGEESGEAKESARLDRETENEIRLMRERAEIEGLVSPSEVTEMRSEYERQLDEYRSVFDLDRFDDRSCHVMLDVYEAERGPRGALYLGGGNMVAESLISDGVLEMRDNALRDGRRAFRLTPEWRRFVRNHLDELRERTLGMDS